MKINNWNRFNESVTEPFTEEMAQEIIYYFSENSKPSKHIGDLFDKWGEIIENNFIMYETSYQEMKQMIKKMYSLCQTDVMFRDSMIEIYNEIRKERKDFPEAYEIEDAFLDLIEGHGFSFMIYSELDKGKIKYQIKLHSPWGDNSMKLEDFINYCNLMKNPISKLSKYRTKLVECNFFDMRYSYCAFVVEITN
jgi:hypothetical protein